MAVTLPKLLGGKRRHSQTSILSKKIEVVTSPHLEEPQWDIVMDIIDALNNDSNRAKRVLNHLKKIIEKSMLQSCDNQQLYNSLTVIDSLVRNGNHNILSVIHSQYLPLLSRLAKKADIDEKHKSLIQSNKKTCRNRVLELIMHWSLYNNDNINMNDKKYPDFRETYLKLKQDGLPFDQININNNNNQQSNNNNDDNNNHNNNHNMDEEKKEDILINNNNNNNNAIITPWDSCYLSFGKWYKNKLKENLRQLADMICMAQDVIAMKNLEDAKVLCMELREANRRLVSIMLRAKDAGAADTLMQWVIIISSLLDCTKKLQKQQRYQIPGVSRQFLQILIDCL